MKKQVKILKVAVTIIIIFTLCITNVYAEELASFEKVQEYSSNFTDIKQTDWFANDVINTYEAGLFKGKTENLFEPYGNITLAEAITIVSRIHSIYNGGTGIIEGSSSLEWYSKYVDYAVNNGIFKLDEFKNYNSNATRAELIYLIYNTINLSELSKINNITSLPDVNEDTIYNNEILSLYNAGIITGSDEYGTFKPNTNINRAETSAIINRVINIDKRQIVNLINDDNVLNIKEIAGLKITSLSDIGEYLASEMVTGNTNIDMKNNSIFDENTSKAEIKNILKDLVIEVNYQNPLIFGVNSFIYYSTTDALFVNYTYDRTEQEKLQITVGQKAKEIIDEIIKPGMTYLEREIAINDYLCANIEYDTKAADELIEKGNVSNVNSFNAYGALIDGLAVCEGYAQAFKLLCNEAGITSIVVTGHLDEIGHAWNRVMIDDKWYDVDVTNNDKENLYNGAFNLPKQIADEFLTEDNYYITDDNQNSLERGTSNEFEYYNYISKYFEENEIYNFLVNNIKVDTTLTFRTNSDYTMNSLKSTLTKALKKVNKRISISYITHLGVVYVDCAK